MNDDMDAYMNHDLLEKVIKKINTAPIADAQPVVHAQWICDTPNFPVMGLYRYHCSACDRDIWIKSKELITEYPYCHCGAKMKGET